MIKHFDHVAIFDCPEPGSFHSKLAFVLELSSGKLQKCKKHYLFDTKFLQVGELPTGSSKYVPNQILFRKRRILRNKIKPSCFAQFPWSSNLNLSIFLELSNDLHENWGAPNWDLFSCKNHRAQNSECTASLKSKRFFAKNIVFYVISLYWESQNMVSRRKIPWKWWPPETKTMGAIAQNESKWTSRSLLGAILEAMPEMLKTSF